MRTSLLASVVLASSTLCLAQDQNPETLSPRAEFARFEREQDGAWRVQWHPATGTPSAIYGTGLAIEGWRENTLAEARRHAEQLLRDRADLLGLGASDFREVIGARMGRTWSFTFEQHFRGLPVIDGRADVRVNMSGVVAMFGARAWPIPADFETTPSIDADVATAIAWRALGERPNHDGDAAQAPQARRRKAPRLVIWGDTDAAKLAPFALAWEVAVDNDDGSGGGFVGRYYIDATNGRVLHQRSDRHDCGFAGCSHGAPRATENAEPNAAADATTPTVRLTTTPSPSPIVTTVTVMGWTRTGTDAFSALQNVPLPGVVVNVPGVGVRTTDEFGQFDIDITQPVNLTINGIAGRHHGTITGPSAPLGTVTVNPGVQATLQLLTAGATVEQAAHTTASWWVDRTNEWARSILGNTAQLSIASNVAIEVNINSTCNAGYQSFSNSTHFFRAGSGCSNTAFSTVIAHEWGHGLDDRYGGIANSNSEGLSEGWGDIIGMYQVDSPLLGSGFQSPGQPLRNGNNTRVYPYASGVAPHPAGEVWMGFAWRYREALRAALGTPQAIAISNETVVGSIVANATTRIDAVREVFLADDDDGNLLNGTPHYDQLETAAVQKGIPYPEVQAVTIAHTPLPSTSLRKVPREVRAIATPGFGQVNALRLVFDAGAGQAVRPMLPMASANQYVALLPGVDNGSVQYHIEVDHSSGVTVRAPETGEYSFAISGGTFAPFYTETFETGASGWTHAPVGGGQDDWQLGFPAGSSGTSEGVTWSDPSAPFAGNNCYSNDLGNTIGGQPWNGQYRADTENFLRSPIINCAGRTGVTLRFRRWLTIEEGQYDQATLLVNGQQVWQNPQLGHTRDTGWVEVEYPLPMADNNPIVWIEWRLKSDQLLHLGGWNIDDVQLGELSFAPLDVAYELTPEQAQSGAPLTMSVKTQGGSRPFLVGMGDAQGPIVAHGLPVLWLGGNVATAGAVTDANGDFSINLIAPTVPAATGVRIWSQVLTLDQAFANFVASNRWINLITN